MADQRSIARDWGTIEAARTWAEREAPSLANDEAYLRWSAKCIRYGASPAAALAFNEIRYGTDIRSILGSVQAPTLVMWRAAGDWGAGDQQGSQFLADRIPGAKYVELPGNEYWPRAGNMDEFLDTVEGFVHSIRAEQVAFDRYLGTVLFTDIVGSTRRSAVGRGDAGWRTTLENHHRIGSRRRSPATGASRWTPPATASSATFHGPARAVHCALAIVEAVRELGIEVRAGIHTGEVETIARRPAGSRSGRGPGRREAGASEVLAWRP